MLEKITSFLNALKASVLAAIALGLVVVLLVLSYRSGKIKQRITEAQLAATKAQLADVLKKHEAVYGVGIKERAVPLTQKQVAFVGDVKKADPKATVSAVSNVGVKIEDEAKGSVTTAAGSPCPTSVVDEYGRFRFDLPSGLLHRSQELGLSIVSVRGVDGAYRLQQADFREYVPGTTTEIPTTGAKINLDYKFVEETAPGPGRFHLYGVAVVDQRLAPGLGVQIEPLRHVTLAGLGLYSPKDKDFSAALHLGYRPGEWAIAFGPLVGYSTRTKVGFGVGATIRVWGAN